jgi:hypothetical protein
MPRRYRRPTATRKTPQSAGCEIQSGRATMLALKFVAVAFWRKDDSASLGVKPAGNEWLNAVRSSVTEGNSRSEGLPAAG